MVLPFIRNDDGGVDGAGEGDVVEGVEQLEKSLELMFSSSDKNYLHMIVSLVISDIKDWMGANDQHTLGKM